MKTLILLLLVLVGCGSGEDDTATSDISITNSCERSTIINNSNECDLSNNTENDVDSDDSVSDFLWKPISESDGKLVVLTNPENATVDVIGDISETLEDKGASNGRGTTARGSFAGCDYGKDITVTISKNGKTLETILIPDGCQRLEK